MGLLIEGPKLRILVKQQGQKIHIVPPGWDFRSTSCATNFPREAPLYRDELVAPEELRRMTDHLCKFCVGVLTAWHPVLMKELSSSALGDVLLGSRRTRENER